jgi:5'-phosphate synthase pdxT subunit
MPYKIGILGLQGAFAKHAQLLNRLGVEVELIRYAAQFEHCQGIVIPGGESTTMTKIINEMQLYEKLSNFPGVIFGTCAGAILLADDLNDPKVRSLKRVPIQIMRNAYGRQVDSFISPIQLSFDQEPFKAVFIRAPRFGRIEDHVQVLGTLNGEPVLVRNSHNLLATFHPELTDDERIHRYFLRMVAEVSQ